MATVALIGSRNFPDLQRVCDYVAGLPEGTLVISGGARGPDRAAIEAARENGLSYQEYLPDVGRWGSPQAFFVRNRTVINRADEVVAFWDGQSHGTLHALRLALARDLPIRIELPNQEVLTHSPSP